MVPHGLSSPHAAPVTANDSADRWGQRLAGILDSAGWRIERRGSDLPPRPMAQFAALDPHDKRIVLYIPFLRWIAARWDQPDAVALLGLAPRSSIPERLAPLPEAERLQWLEILALAHEFHHAMDEDSALRKHGMSALLETSGKNGLPGSRTESETAARESAEKIFNRLWEGVTQNTLAI